MPFEIEIKESDFERFSHQKKKTPILGDDSSENDRIIENLLPEVITNKISKIIPPDFKLKEMSLVVTVKGTPFGIGIKGDVAIKFGPE